MVRGACKGLGGPAAPSLPTGALAKVVRQEVKLDKKGSRMHLSLPTLDPYAFFEIRVRGH